MRIMGIDPGYAIVGYGTVEYINNKFYPVEFGAITTKAHTPFENRLQEVYTGLDEVIKRAKPQAIAIEQLFFTTNQKTVIQVAMARGVILLWLEKVPKPDDTADALAVAICHCHSCRSQLRNLGTQKK